MKDFATAPVAGIITLILKQANFIFATGAFESQNQTLMRKQTPMEHGDSKAERHVTGK